MEAHHFASLSADSGETIHDGLVKTIGLYRREVLNCIAGIAVARGPRCGQPFSACHYWWQKDVSKGVKWDRTAVNAGAQAWNMIRPLSWIEVLSCQNCVWERETEAEGDCEWHCFRVLSPTRSTMQALCPSHYDWSIVWCIFWMHEHLLLAHMLYSQREKKRSLCTEPRHQNGSW